MGDTITEFITTGQLRELRQRLANLQGECERLEQREAVWSTEADEARLERDEAYRERDKAVAENVGLRAAIAILKGG